MEAILMSGRERKWLVVEALSLDLRPLWESYSGRGSLPYSPELMLAMVLVEKQRGRSSPSQWGIALNETAWRYSSIQSTNKKTPPTIGQSWREFL